MKDERGRGVNGFWRGRNKWVNKGMVTEGGTGILTVKERMNG